jgi:hypothetical protein
MIGFLLLIVMLIGETTIVGNGVRAELSSPVRL